jgi:hypothetical protein
VEEVGVESLIVNVDFNPQAPGTRLPGLSPEEVDDLAELDALSRSLDGLDAGGEAPRPPSAAVKVAPTVDEATMVRPPATAAREPESTVTAMLVLKATDGTARSKFALRRGLSTVGRGLDNEVVLDDRAVSRKHATIAFEADGSYRVTDLGSENGTYVNGARISSTILKDGDEVHVGKSTLVFSQSR